MAWFKSVSESLRQGDGRTGLKPMELAMGLPRMSLLKCCGAWLIWRMLLKVRESAPWQGTGIQSIARPGGVAFRSVERYLFISWLISCVRSNGAEMVCLAADGKEIYCRQKYIRTVRFWKNTRHFSWCLPSLSLGLIARSSSWNKDFVLTKQGILYSPQPPLLCIKTHFLFPKGSDPFSLEIITAYFCKLSKNRKAVILTAATTQPQKWWWWYCW